MLLNILKSSFFNQKKAMALMIISVSVGTSITASLLTVSFDISGKVAKELRSFGANIIIEAKTEGLADVVFRRRYLYEEDIIKAKTIFWRHNIVGLSPFLEAKGTLELNGIKAEVKLVGSWYDREMPLPGEAGSFKGGIKTVFPWWRIEGKWPSDNEVLIGVAVASRMGIKIGDRLMIDGRPLLVTGIMDSGGREDNLIFLDLASLQEMKDLKGLVSQVLVSALTTPMDEFAYRDPETMTKTEYEKWYCTGYVTSIAKQLEEVFKGSRAKPIWQVAETEGKVLERLRLLIYLLSAISLIASSLGVSTTMIMSLLRRIEEIGLMKALGADRSRIIMIFFAEGAIISLIGGVSGYVIAIFIANFIGLQVFNSVLEQRTMLFPLSMGSSLLIAIGATILPIKRAIKIRPAIVLKGLE